MSVIKRYLNFILRTTVLLAVLTAMSSLLATFIGVMIMMPWWFSPTITIITLIVGSYIVFKSQEKQITLKLFKELEDFSKNFYGLTMGGSENREIQIRFILDRVNISDRSEKEVLRIRGKGIRDCHDLIEKWFECYKHEVEYFLKNPKSIDVDNTIRLISEFKNIIYHYHDKVIDATMDYVNDIKYFPKDLIERFETKFDALKSKYNYFGNQFNDYIKRLNKELSYNMDGISIISKELKIENEAELKLATTQRGM